MSSEQSISARAVEYREIPDHPGYRVGDDGSVWSCIRRARGPGSKGRRGQIGDTWKQLAPVVEFGYSLVVLYPSRKKLRVHRLVLLAFVGPCPAGMECRHLDGDRSNNGLSNLCWGTKEQNRADRIAHGTNNHGENNWMTKLTDESVRQIRAEYATAHDGQTRTPYGLLVQIGKKHGITGDHVGLIVKRKCWRHI